MAKQKAKAPPVTALAARSLLGTEAAPAAPGAAAAKRKLKNARKGKVRAAADSAGLNGQRVPARQKRLVKAIRKKGFGGAMVGAEGLAAKNFEGLAGVPAVVRKRKAVRPPPPLGRLERLEIALSEVRIGARTSLRTRKLLSSGMPKMAQKVIEEAAEAAIEAIRGDRTAFVAESVDLFYNLLVLASEIGVPLTAIWTEMDRREQLLGMAEKLPKTPEP